MNLIDGETPSGAIILLVLCIIAFYACFKFSKTNNKIHTMYTTSYTDSTITINEYKYREIPDTNIYDTISKHCALFDRYLTIDLYNYIGIDSTNNESYILHKIELCDNTLRVKYDLEGIKHEIETTQEKKIELEKQLQTIKNQLDSIQKPSKKDTLPKNYTYIN